LDIFIFHDRETLFVLLILSRMRIRRSALHGNVFDLFCTAKMPSALCQSQTYNSPWSLQRACTNGSKLGQCKPQLSASATMWRMVLLCITFHEAGLVPGPGPERKRRNAP
jgi:hypothetical protein